VWYGFVIVRNGISRFSSAGKRLHRFEYLEEFEKMRCLTMRGRSVEGFILLGEQEILGTFGTLIDLKTEISRLLERTRSIGSGGSKECRLVAMLHRDEYQEFCQLGWIDHVYNLLESDTAMFTL
jgi:hypothetical protein